MGIFDRDKSLGKIAERENFKMVLAKYGIDVNAFGQGEAKTLDDLFDEITAGETTLVEHKGQLLRLVRFAGVNVYYGDGKHEWILDQTRQVFRDGRSRPRNVGFSVSEKLTEGEKPEQGAKRGMREELKEIAAIENVKLEGRGNSKETLLSPSYPGLISRYDKYAFVAKLNASQFNPQGYVAKEASKDTYFVWRQIK